MEKNITIEKIVSEINKLNNTEKKEEYIKKNVKSEQYIPYVQKYTYANDIVLETSYQHQTDENDISKRTSIIKINNSARYMLKIWTIISIYTNIEMKPEEKIKDFDLMEENGITEMILKVIPESEIICFNNLIAMCEDDFYANNMSAQAFTLGTISMVVEALTKKLEPLFPVLESLQAKIENMDEKEIDKINSNIVKMFDRMKK